ncbi:2-oxo acid dehydrogenase subunit E2 [Desertivirga brevis]|uniref:2-oxo acid dehydrogenase subunit E2 n=1 Tax=Desertivirga brevis TaxID=2810310 RepID=UPI001A95AE56|nr:2-oxo acid dehydrogenase subunit E2 [Pedobacter sp. SYSU D00873]
MAEVVRMPKMSDTMTEGVIAKWHKKVGDKVSTGDLIAEVETDKATMDFESFQEGTVLYIGAEEGSAVPVDQVIAVLGAPGEDYKPLLEGGSAPKAEAKSESAPAETAAPAEEEEAGIDPESVGATVIRMPLLSDTMTEGVIAEWHKNVGDTVKSDDTLADVETDKATMEVTAYAEGTLLYVGVEKGQAAKVNDIIAIVGKPGTDVAPLLKGGKKAATNPTEGNKAQETSAAPQPAETAAQTVSSSDSRVKASPLAKKIAQEKGIDLSQVKGSAEGGRIVKADVENFTPSAKPAASAAAPEAAAAPAPAAKAEKTITIPQFIGEEKYTEKPVTQMRKAIARSLSDSLFTAPHIFITMSIDMDNAIAARAKINEYAPVKISFNDLVVKATAIALKQHPALNSSWLGDKIRINEHVNIGVAVAVDEGLVVPVVKFADGKSLTHISLEVKDFAGKAKSKKLLPTDMQGSTFTISNLGMFGVDEFTAIINPPNSAILAVSGIQQVPVVKNGAVVPGNIMKLTVSGDHRVLDGASVAAFLQTLKALLEEPVRLLV